MSAEPLSAIQAAWESELRRDEWTPKPREYVYASAHRTCTRAMSLDMLHPEDRGEFSADQLERMRRGKEREAAIVARLHQIGPRCAPPFEVVEGQRPFDVSDRDGTKLIAGKIDGRLRLADGSKPVFEVKSGESFRRIEALDDFERSPWTRHAPDQLLSYLYASSEPWGFFILDRPKMPAFIRVDLLGNIHRVENFMARAREAVDGAKNGHMPPFIQNAAECRRCDHFGKSCTPPLDFGAGAQVITDERLITLASVREANRIQAKEYEAADAELKAALRGTELGILGDYQVTGKWQPQTKYDVPKDVKELYAKVDPKGRFVLSIEKIEEGK